jgi:hypothetical protein
MKIPICRVFQSPIILFLLRTKIRLNTFSSTAQFCFPQYQGPSFTPLQKLREIMNLYVLIFTLLE